MTGRSSVTRLRVALVLAILVSFHLSGCALQSSGECGAGSSVSAEDAVERLLVASEAGDEKEACIVLARGEGSGYVSENLADIQPFVVSAGGVGNLLIQENAVERMGAEHIVDVTVSDSADKMQFHVLELGGRFTVVPWSDYAPQSDG